LNWYLIVLLVVIGLSHLHTVLKTTANESGVEASASVLLTALFWWLVYMSGIFTLL